MAPLVIAPFGVPRVPATVPGEPGVVGRVIAMIVPFGAVVAPVAEVANKQVAAKIVPKLAGAIGHSPGPLILGPAVSV